METGFGYDRKSSSSAVVLNQEWIIFISFRRLEKPNELEENFTLAQLLETFRLSWKKISRFICTHCVSLVKEMVSLQAKIDQLTSELRVQASLVQGTDTYNRNKKKPRTHNAPPVNKPPVKITLFSSEGLDSISRKVHFAT